MALRNRYEALNAGSRGHEDGQPEKQGRDVEPVSCEPWQLAGGRCSHAGSLACMRALVCWCYSACWIFGAS